MSGSLHPFHQICKCEQNIKFAEVVKRFKHSPKSCQILKKTQYSFQIWKLISNMWNELQTILIWPKKQEVCYKGRKVARKTMTPATCLKPGQPSHRD